MFTLVALTTLVVAQLGDGPSVDSFGQVSAGFEAAAAPLTAGSAPVPLSPMRASENASGSREIVADPNVSAAAWSDMPEGSPQGADYLTREQVQAECKMIYSNLLYDATKNLQVGMEVDVWKTHYIDLKAGEAVRIECAVKYMF